MASWKKNFKKNKSNTKIKLEKVDIKIRKNIWEVIAKI